MEDLFPKKEGLNYSDLKVTEEGTYSITRRRDAVRIFNTLIHAIPELKTLMITDATACIGGDTINFALHCKQVHSIEFKKDNYEALKANVGAYKFDNVYVYNEDATTFFDWYTDILYIDPPWGGKSYRDYKELDLHLSAKRLDNWLEEILLRKNRPKYIILKLPYNYNFKRLNFLSNVDVIRPYQIRSYVLVVITVHRPSPKQSHQSL